MNRYTIYCTEEQTKKALELGAPIKINYHPPFNGENFMWLSPPADAIAWNNSTNCLIPTAEEMIGWLEEQKIFVDIAPCFDISCSWRIESKSYNKYEYTSDIKVCKTRKEATLAAIDAALDYLIYKQ